MSNQVAVIKQRLPMPKGLTDMDEGKWRVLCEAVFPSAKSAESIAMAIDYCKARNLDIFKRPVNIVPMWNSTLKKNVETIWPGINEVQVTAARTGKYAGMDEPKWGPDKTRTFEGLNKWKDDNDKWQEQALKVELTYPESCSVTVYRMVEGQRCPFAEPVFWEEAYAKQGKTEVPNNMWQKRARGQLLKVAKAFSLRAAFPEEGEYVAEEMEGLEIKAGGVVIDQPSMTNITPSETDHSKPASPFKNAALRKQFHENIVKNFHAAKTHKELQELMLMDKPKFEEMEASGSEADEMSLGEIRKQYQIAWNRLIKHDEETGEVVDEQMQAMRAGMPQDF